MIHVEFGFCEIISKNRKRTSRNKPARKMQLNNGDLNFRIRNLNLSLP